MATGCTAPYKPAATVTANGADPRARGAEAASVPTPAAAARCAQLLSQHSADTDTDSAFGKLFGLWSAKYQASGTDPCTPGGQPGPGVSSRNAARFGQLRLYNRPAILLLNDGAR